MTLIKKFFIMRIGINILQILINKKNMILEIAILTLKFNNKHRPKIIIKQHRSLCQTRTQYKNQKETMNRIKY